MQAVAQNYILEEKLDVFTIPIPESFNSTPQESISWLKQDRSSWIWWVRKMGKD
jgi:hypothetical protein